MAKRKLNIPGRGMVEADQVSFRPMQEHWNEYHLDDGSTIRLKLVATGIYKVPDAYDAVGDPVYFVTSTNVIAVDAPEELRKEGS